MTPKSIMFIDCIYHTVVIIVFFQVTRIRTRSWLKWKDRSRMQFCQPLQQRLAIFLVVTAVAAVLPIFAFDSPYPMFVYSVSIGVVLLGSYWCGPNDTLIDGERRIYERTEGWPWRQRRRLGSFDEIAGVSITTSHTVLLRLKRQDFLQSSFWVDWPQTEAEAIAMAKKISETTGLPIIKHQG